MGPSVSNTSLHRPGKNVVYAGSKSLNAILEKDDCVALLHGHVHFGSRYDRYLCKDIVMRASQLSTLEHYRRDNMPLSSSLGAIRFGSWLRFHSKN